MTALDPQVRIASLERELHWAQLKIQVLEERLRQQRIKMLGPHSETLSDLQLELLVEQEPGVTGEEVEAESRRAPMAVMPEREPRRSHPGRRSLPENLPRVEQVIRCSGATCPACGSETTLLGYDESEQLDIEPARYFVRVIKREKRVCGSCTAGTVTAAPLPERIVEKGLASNRVVIQTVISKYCDHLPLYRQAVMLEREAGIDIGRATLDGWVMRVGELLQPVVEAMRRDLLGASYLQADETTVPVQCTMAAEQTTRVTYGNTAGREERPFSISSWAEGVKDRAGSWEVGKAYCKPTAIKATTEWAGRNWCTWDVGRIIQTQTLSRVVRPKASQ